MEFMNASECDDDKLKLEPKIKTEEDASSFSGEIREVRIMVQDVMKNDTIKRELEEDRYTIVKSEPEEKRIKSEDEKYDEWEAIQKELSVYSVGKDGAKADAIPSPMQQDVELDSESVKVVNNNNSVDSTSDPATLRTSGPVSESMDVVANKSPVWAKDNFVTDSSSGTVPPPPPVLNSDVGINGSLELGLDSSSPSPPILNPGSVVSQSTSEQKDLEDSSPNVTCGEDDIHAQVQSAIDSILNLQRGDDGGGATAPSVANNTTNSNSSTFPVLEGEPLSDEESPVALAPVTEFNGEVNHYDDDDETALDEAVRSILS